MLDVIEILENKALKSQIAIDVQDVWSQLWTFFFS